jgi:hypothetical protein
MLQPFVSISIFEQSQAMLWPLTLKTLFIASGIRGPDEPSRSPWLWWEWEPQGGPTIGALVCTISLDHFLLQSLVSISFHAASTSDTTTRNWKTWTKHGQKFDVQRSSDNTNDLCYPSGLQAWDQGLHRSSLAAPRTAPNRTQNSLDRLISL